MIVSIVQLINRLGVFGVDMYLSDIAEDVIYYNKYQDSYAFLIDVNGFAIMHPSYPRPMDIHSNPFPTDIKYLEQVEGFTGVREKILNMTSGKYTIFGNLNGLNKTVSGFQCTTLIVVEF